MEKRVVLNHRVLPYVLLAPQLAVTLLFFLWPAAQALYQSLLRQDPFGLKTTFVGFANFEKLFTDPLYLASLQVTTVFSLCVAGISMGMALLLAIMADRVVKAAQTYKTLIMWPYAVAPVVAGALWWLIFNPTVGVLAYALRGLGYEWNHYISGTDAFILVVIAAAWKQISYNFLFFLAGLQSIPRALVEAAAIDGAGPARRFWTIIFPLLSPTTFFLLVVNVTYAFFDTFAIIHGTTTGGPGQSTTILVYKVFVDGFIALDLGSSAAQSVLLMVIVIALTVVQFRFVERQVHY